MTTIEHFVTVPARAEDVWARIVTSEGFNHEMRPWVSMTLPRRARGLTVDALPLGRTTGRAWLRLFGVVPFDYDRLVIVEVDPGRRFLERSTMLSMRRWEHERTVTEVRRGSEVHDRVTFEPRLPARLFDGLLARGISAFFRHRQRRLSAYFADNAPVV